MSQEVRKVRLFAGARRNIRAVILHSTLTTILWALQFVYQYYALIPGELGGSMLRSFALTGATLIGFALAIGPLRTLHQKYNYVRYRRTIGVWGFTFIILHFVSVMVFLFELNPIDLFWHYNPFANPIIFAVFAYPIFVSMWITSTDWAVARLGFRKWKSLHRLVFPAYIVAILHFTLINPELLLNPTGYLLIGTTILVLILQVSAFLKTIRGKGLGRSAAIGFSLMIVGASLFTTAYRFRDAVAGDVEPNPNLPTSVAVTKMKEFMKQKGGNPEVAGAPIEADKNFVAAMMKTGMFERLNYMTSGAVMLENKDGKHFVVFGDDFTTPNGPDLVIYLTKNTGPSTRQDVRDGIQLAPLKSTTGKQVYEIPEGVDVSQFNSVTIHCRAFNVPWSYAPLK
ncbi:MAG: DM13 domain-containing protein [Thaumarchaeota archaeon]|nr:DM13 domain-containing protein [Nitrososphaerota archaeon]